MGRKVDNMPPRRVNFERVDTSRHSTQFNDETKDNCNNTFLFVVIAVLAFALSLEVYTHHILK